MLLHLDLSWLATESFDDCVSSRESLPMELPLGPKSRNDVTRLRDTSKSVEDIAGDSTVVGVRRNGALDGTASLSFGLSLSVSAVFVSESSNLT